ncbi:hypothetical protein A9Z06_19365 [Rhizobium sp. YK2]|nr:hypothetical protein A9Z06_19365 [Rhizobium sp. YK2]
MERACLYRLDATLPLTQETRFGTFALRSAKHNLLTCKHPSRTFTLRHDECRGWPLIGPQRIE